MKTFRNKLNSCHKVKTSTGGNFHITLYECFFICFSVGSHMFINDSVYCFCVLFCVMNYMNNLRVVFSVLVPSRMVQCNTF